LCKLLVLPDERPLAAYRIPRPVRVPGEVQARYAVETEPHVRAILRKLVADPPHPFSLDVEPTVRLYLPHTSAEVDLAENEWATSLKRELPLYALDVRGLGESLPEEQGGGFFQPYGMDYMMHAYGLMLGQSYLGRRLYDVLCVLDLLVHEGAEVVSLFGRGQGAILALLATLFHDKVALATLKDAPRSFFEWTQTPYVTWPAANFVRGMLHLCDLPDILEVLGDRVEIVDCWGPAMEPVSQYP
jgi:pimeloyl-ACP methyl ester carboxylesterase